MTITGIVTAIIIGAIIGRSGPAHPARQAENIPIWLTIVVRIVAAVLGTAIARAVVIPTVTSGIHWLEVLVQLIVAVIVAVIGVAVVVGLYSRRSVQHQRTRRWPQRTSRRRASAQPDESAEPGRPPLGGDHHLPSVSSEPRDRASTAPPIHPTASFPRSTPIHPTIQRSAMTSTAGPGLSAQTVQVFAFLVRTPLS